jgi:hypothetical protein
VDWSVMTLSRESPAQRRVSRYLWNVWLIFLTITFTAGRKCFKLLQFADLATPRHLFITAGGLSRVSRPIQANAT